MKSLYVFILVLGMAACAHSNNEDVKNANERKEGWDDNLDYLSKKCADEVYKLRNDIVNQENAVNICFCYYNEVSYIHSFEHYAHNRSDLETQSLKEKVLKPCIEKEGFLWAHERGIYKK